MDLGDVHRFEKLKRLSFNIIELSFYQDKIKCKQKLIPSGISKNFYDGVVDLLIYKNDYVLIKILHIFLGKRDSNFVFRT